MVWITPSFTLARHLFETFLGRFERITECQWYRSPRRFPNGRSLADSQCGSARLIRAVTCFTWRLLCDRRSNYRKIIHFAHRSIDHRTKTISTRPHRHAFQCSNCWLLLGAFANQPPNFIVLRYARYVASRSFRSHHFLVSKRKWKTHSNLMAIKFIKSISFRWSTAIWAQLSNEMLVRKSPLLEFRFQLDEQWPGKWDD